ncbi:hypothetical protein [Neisseria sp. Ec49-e6-T10]|uniref:hypothetical protein n=1 Tax=Neisseria sp. Ec49-e6-T10 TaxID=3140744 RepID=UPI003EB9D359
MNIWGAVSMNIGAYINGRLSLCWHHHNKECVCNALQELIVCDQADLCDYFILGRLLVEQKRYQYAIKALSSYITLCIENIEQVSHFISNHHKAAIGAEYHLNIAYLLRAYVYALVGQQEKALKDLETMMVYSKHSILDNILWLDGHSDISHRSVLALI